MAKRSGTGTQLPVARPGAECPHVALIVETSLAPGRDMLRGIAQYIREHGPWSTFLEPRNIEESVPAWLRRWRGDGIIARIQNRQIADAVLATGLPTVDLLGEVGGSPVPLVHTDNARIASLAAEHLLERGFRRFGFFGLSSESWSRQRRDAFIRLVNGSGFPCKVYETPRHIHHTRMWEDYADDLAAWVRGLEKPVGLMVCSDQCGPIMLEACRRAPAAVPDEVAVIGVDNDEPLCEVSDPALTSVWPDHVRVGYEGAALLDRLMRGNGNGAKVRRRSTAPVFIPPRGVVTRRSTDVLAIEDPDVAAALRFIRQRACDGPTVDEVADHAALSRSVLQRRFKRAVGRTLHDEMLRVRLRRAQELLAGTDLPIALIAERAGFRHQEYMGAVFRTRLRQTPAQFRKLHRRAHPAPAPAGGASI